MGMGGVLKVGILLREILVSGRSEAFGMTSCAVDCVPVLPTGQLSQGQSTRATLQNGNPDPWSSTCPVATYIAARVC